MKDFFEKLLQLSKDNPVMAGVISLYGAGILTYFCKDIPKKFLAFLKKHFTTTLSIANDSQCYYSLLSIIEKKNVSNKIRSIKLFNDPYKGNQFVTKGIGSGDHIIYFKGVFIKASLQTHEVLSKEEKLSIVLTKLGRSHRLFDEIKKDLELYWEEQFFKQESRTHTTIYQWSNGDYWDSILSYPKRDFSTIFIKEENKNQLTTSLDNFIKSENWYIKRGVPYQYGLLLYGEPGSGKTSLIKAIASYTNKNIATLSADSLYSLPKAIAKLPDHTILVIEDIDSSSRVKSRSKLTDQYNSVEDNGGDSNISPPRDSLAESMIGMGLSEVLNALDGLIYKHGRMIIMTTNYIDKLDSALIRPGRIDLKMYLGYIDIEVFQKFLSIFFPEESSIYDFSKIKKIEEVVVAELQQKFLEGKTFNWFIENYSIKEN